MGGAVLRLDSEAHRDSSATAPLRFQVDVSISMIVRDSPADNKRGQRYKVVNITRQATLAAASRKARGPIGRALGLMGRKELPDGAGLIIEPCNSVVSFFMRFPIDVLFVNAEGKVLHIKENMVPWRTSKIVRGSRFVIELPAGSARSSRTQVGDEISIQPG